MKQKKILFCDNSLRELLNFRGEIIKYYASQNYQVVLIAPQNQDYTPPKNIKYIPIKLNRSGMNLFSELIYFNTLRKIYKKEKPDYIFHYTIKPNIYGTLAASLCNIPCTAIIAGLGYVFNEPGIKTLIARMLYEFALRFAENVLVLNVSNRRFLLEHKIVASTKLILLQGGEGINLKQFTPQESSQQSDENVFLMIARVLYDKGYSEYVEAARLVKRKYPNAEFQLLGTIDSEYPNHVPAGKIERDHVNGTINYLGFSLNVIPKIQVADCIVLPSYNEGLSRVLIEALAMGKPIITTDIPGCRETVESRKNGFIIPPRDSNALAAAIEKFIITGNTERMAMGKYSRQKAEKEFNIIDVVNLYKKITASVE